MDPELRGKMWARDCEVGVIGVGVQAMGMGENAQEEQEAQLQGTETVRVCNRRSCQEGRENREQVSGS